MFTAGDSKHFRCFKFKSFDVEPDVRLYLYFFFYFNKGAETFCPDVWLSELQ